MKKTSILISISIVLAIVAVGSLWYGLFYLPEQYTDGTYHDDVTNFEECVAAGFPVMESYPRQCRVTGGELFVEEIGNAIEKRDLIHLTFPKAGDTITSPLVITGEARGNWFFEATFPISLTDWDGRIIAEGYAEATSDWMTESFVPFTGTLTFTTPSYGTAGSLILQKANASGLPEHDDALEIVIQFDQSEIATSTEYITCPPESRLADACIQVYEPVCGSVQVECITTPCDPVPETFSNACEACRNERVSTYTPGACQ